MKFTFALFLSSVLATCAFAQRIAIGAPADFATVSAGSTITVEIDRPNFNSQASEVAVVIALQSCFNGVCAAPSNVLGSKLYAGPFYPQYNSGTVSKPPYQNFSVNIPASAKGLNQLNVAHFSLVGAANSPFLEFQNVTLNVV